MLRPRVLPALAGLAALTLSVVSIGTPSTLVLLGGWLLAPALARWAPGLSGPASWAAAVAVEVGLLTAENMLLAALLGHDHGRTAELALLTLPLLLGAVLLLLGRDRGRPAQPSRWGIAATITTVGLVLPMWVRSRGTDYGLAWAASGDARNHALMVRHIMDAGGLTTTQLRGYPALIDGFTGMLSGAGGRHGLTAGALLVHDLSAMTATYVLSGIALAALIAAALLELLPSALAARRQLPVAVLVVVLAAGWLSTTPLVLGTSLLDGYLSSYGTLPLSMASLVLALRCCRTPSPAAYALMGPAAVLVFFSWTLVAVAPVLLVPLVGVVMAAAAGRRLLTRPSRRTLVSWALSATTSLGCALALALAGVLHRDELHRQVLAPGSVTPPWHGILVLALVLSVGSVVVAGGSVRRRQLLVAVLASVAAIVTVRVLVWLSPDGRTWTYYAGKTLYMSAATLAWLAFAPILLILTWRQWDTASTRLVAFGRTALAVAGSAALLAALPAVSHVQDKLGQATSGWKQPTAAVLAEDVRMADTGHPFLLWHWSDGGNDRLGNFWAALAWSYNQHGAPLRYQPDLAGGVEYWAYVENGGIHDLCRVATAVPQLTVVTHLSNLSAQLAKRCPGTHTQVVLAAPPTGAVRPSGRPTPPATAGQ